MAIEVAAQRLEIGDVVLMDLSEEERPVEATVVRDIDRTDTTVRVTFRVGGREASSESGRLVRGHRGAGSVRSRIGALERGPRRR